MGCRHYWLVVGAKGHRWLKGHALARCAHCPAWTVVGYQEGIGPCPHIVGRRPEELPRHENQCPGCGMLWSEDDPELGGVGGCPAWLDGQKTPS